MILLGGPQRQVEIATSASVVVLFPTILDWMGFGLASAGLGQFLLRGNGPPTLVEEYGLDPLGTALQNATGLADRLWTGAS